MSLARLALRIATCEALRPTPALTAAGPWPTPLGPFPTSAGALVFDSLEAPINDLADGERRPVIVVYTDDDSAEPGQKAGGPPFLCTVDLVFEISVAQAGTLDGAFVVGTPSTDPECEAVLDLIEAQIKFVLCYGPTGKLWREQLTARRIVDISSIPHRTSEEGVRLARRSMRMKVKINDDAFDPVPALDPVGNDRLPDPLKTLVGLLAQSSYGRAFVEAAGGIAANAPVMPVAKPLKTVSMKFQPGTPPAAEDDTKEQILASADNLDTQP